MNKDKQNISFPDDSKKDFDLEGIIIEPVENQSSNDTSSFGAAGDSTAGGSAHVIDDNELLEESGIEILRNGKSIDLDDPDLI